MQSLSHNDELLKLVDRSQPQNIDAEEAVLGGCLSDRYAIARIADTLTAEAFYLSAHRHLYRALLALHTADQPTDVMSVLAWLQDAGKLQKVGGQTKLAGLMQGSVGAVNIDHHAALINEKWLRRRAIALGQELTAQAGDPQIELVKLLQDFEAKALALTQQQAKPTVERIGEILPGVFAGIQARSELRTPIGVKSGFYDLDAMTKGFQLSDLIIVAGRPSMGKTSFVMNLTQTAAESNLPTLVFSLEMSKEQLVTRLLSGAAQLESGRLRSGSLGVNDWEALGHGCAKLSWLPLWIDDQPELSIAQIRSTARRIQAQAGQLGMVVIDYLQLMDLGEDPVRELARITKALKGLAKLLNCPVIALSQLNRAVEGRTSKRPMMSDLRESGAIEQDADLILMLYRDEYYHPDTSDRGIVEVIISKHRNGATGTIKLLFEPEFTQFRNLARRLNG